MKASSSPLWVGLWAVFVVVGLCSTCTYRGRFRHGVDPCLANSRNGDRIAAYEALHKKEVITYPRDLKGLEALSHSVNSFSFDLLRVISEKEPKNNIFYSPLSISTASSMLLFGAKGETELELFNALKFRAMFEGQREVHPIYKRLLTSFALSNRSDSSYALVANKIVVAKGYEVLPHFRENLRDNYLATIDEADFAGRGREATDGINRWVANQTHNTIRTLFDEPLEEDTKLVVLNAIYFKGKWRQSFKDIETRAGLFKNSHRAPGRVDYMSTTGNFRHFNNEDKGYELLELPYEGKTSLVILLPKKDDGLDVILRNLNLARLEYDMESLAESRPIRVNVRMPKFRMSGDYDLKDLMMSLGVSDVFSRNADLSAISGVRDLFVSKAIHKAFVEIDEKGTEAAAVSSFVATTRSFTFRRTVYVKVDHPFLFIIRDNESKTHLFVGKVTDSDFS